MVTAAQTVMLVWFVASTLTCLAWCVGAIIRERNASKLDHAVCASQLADFASAPRRPLAGSWDREKVVVFLYLKNARAAAAGRPCPVAALVLSRLEASNG